MAANTLNGEVKLFITHLNARFHTPTEVVGLVKAQYDIDVTAQNVQAYDPTTFTGRALSAELRSEFEAERERFRASVTDIPLANPAYRLRKLQETMDKNNRNPVLVTSILEQAAKEVGGAFTNKKVLTGAGDNGEILINDTRLEEIRARIAAMQAGATADTAAE